MFPLSRRRRLNLQYLASTYAIIFALTCQTSFAQTDDDSSLNDNFNPGIKASCVGGTMTIRVDTKKPFEGIIHGPNRTEPGCAVQGRGGLKTYLRVDLTKAADETGSCGVRYDPTSEERRLAIAVRAHPTIELLEDRLYVVTCGRAGFQNSRNEVSVVILKVSPPSDPEHKVNAVLEGSRYLLRAEVVDHDPNFGILVRRCFAFDDSDSTLQLVDDRGCVVESLISDFSYDHSKGTAEATIYSMFRLPHSNRTYFQCDVAICRGECAKPNCKAERISAAGPPLLTKGEAEESSPVDPFERAEDDAVTTSTSVFVAQPGSEAAAGVYYCSSTIGGLPGDGDWIMWLCVAFGILFGIMLLINIFLCSAMTCSCTRSEIIEKEPSIYDEYSLYDGYNGHGEKPYLGGSESDYGSEYGVQDPSGMPPPSDAGTYRSKYSRNNVHNS